MLIRPNYHHTLGYLPRDVSNELTTYLSRYGDRVDEERTRELMEFLEMLAPMRKRVDTTIDDILAQRSKGADVRGTFEDLRQHFEQLRENPPQQPKGLEKLPITKNWVAGELEYLRVTTQTIGELIRDDTALASGARN